MIQPASQVSTNNTASAATINQRHSFCRASSSTLCILEQLNIGAKPISATELKTYYVSPPRLRAGGSVETPDFFFGFGKDGRLQFITKNLPDAELSLPEKYEKWAKMKSLVDTNGAYALATNWLMKLDVDVAALEKEHPSQVQAPWLCALASLRETLLRKSG